MKLSLIAAIAKNGVIGLDNRLPWHLPEDLKRFRKPTIGKPILMGRKTFDSLPGILDGREHIVLSRDKNYRPKGCTLFRSLPDALKVLHKHAEVMVMGGYLLYEECLPLADNLYLTLIDKEFQGDAYFPEIDPERWKTIERSDFKATEKRPFAFAFLKMIKR